MNRVIIMYLFVATFLVLSTIDAKAQVESSGISQSLTEMPFLKGTGFSVATGFDKFGGNGFLDSWDTRDTRYAGVFGTQFNLNDTFKLQLRAAGDLNGGDNNAGAFPNRGFAAVTKFEFDKFAFQIHGAFGHEDMYKIDDNKIVPDYDAGYETMVGFRIGYKF